MYEVRGVVLVRDGVTGLPKFDKPFWEYPEWAQEAFIEMMTDDEIADLEDILNDILEAA